MYRENKKTTGVYPRIIKAIFQKLGNPFVIRSMGWARVKKQAELGKVVGGGFLKTPEREKIYLFTDAIFEEKVVAYAKGSSSLKINTLSDLKGLKIGTKSNFSYGAAFDKAVKNMGLKVSPVIKDALNFKKITKGRLDIFITDQVVGDNYLKKEGLTGQIKEVGVVSVNPVYMVFGKNDPNSKHIPKINQIIKTLDKNQYR